MNQPKGTTTPNSPVPMGTEVTDSNLICPHCFCFITPITIHVPSGDEDIICINCNRKISQEDLDYVFAENSPLTR